MEAKMPEQNGVNGMNGACSSRKVLLIFVARTTLYPSSMCWYSFVTTIHEDYGGVRIGHVNWHSRGRHLDADSTLRQSYLASKGNEKLTKTRSFAAKAEFTGYNAQREVPISSALQTARWVGNQLRRRTMSS